VVLALLPSVELRATLDDKLVLKGVVRREGCLYRHGHLPDVTFCPLELDAATRLAIEAYDLDLPSQLPRPGVDPTI
jgi:hypothetical protein